MELVDKLHFKDELVMARDLQAQLVPRVLPEIGAFELGAFNRIANTVGGDLYAFEPLQDGRLAVLFGDASGHGMAAGLVMAVTHAVFRTQLSVDPSPAAMVGSLNRVLAETGNARSFFAGVYALLEPGGAVTAIVAGHPPVLKLDAEGRIVERLGTGSYPLGIRKNVEYRPVTTSLAPGETLLFHSDGLPEARGASGEEFGDARIESLLFRRAGARPHEVVASLVQDLDLFMGRTSPRRTTSRSRRSDARARERTRGVPFAAPGAAPRRGCRAPVVHGRARDQARSAARRSASPSGGRSCRRSSSSPCSVRRARAGGTPRSRRRSSTRS